ncbi:MAG: hypothetical protein U1F76_29905 [Candidatus Competibacteraceae bacterium]
MHQSPAVGLIDEEVFRNLIARRARPLFRMINYLLKHKPFTTVLTRPLLGDLLSQSAQLEELLDAYGARNNRYWCRFRAFTAAIKLFASVSYKLLHIQYVLPSYRLLKIDRDFVVATRQAIAFTGSVLEAAALRLLAQAVRMGVTVPVAELQAIDYSEQLPEGHLAHDRHERQVDNAAAIVTHLATAFLNLAAESELLHTVEQSRPEDYAARFPDPVSEENLRYLKHRFHNLQSLYDTYVSETVVEHLDSDLPVLRGHVSIIYHLLEIATDLAHYYERHANLQTGDSALHRQPVVDPEALLLTLMGYAVTYSSLFLSCGQRLCQGMLKRYAEVGVIEVPVPHYRGFHVRPATLVAKIVQHYGSEVRMELDGALYDAGLPLDLFRANEKINARKRRWLAAEIAQSPLLKQAVSKDRIEAAVRNIILKLAEQGKLVIYEQPLQLLPELAEQESGLLEQATAEIARLQATGQIDISSGLTISFIGDKRVLADIALLAKHGYGEDSFGNNIALPKELAYLRR